MNRSTGSAKAERNVTLVIRGDATHPAPGTVGPIGALLAKRPASRGPALQFEPAYACHGIGFDRKVVKQRLTPIWETAISVAEHQTVNKTAQRVRYAQLRH